MSLDYIVNHAILNAWCNPKQDLQSIVKPKRITRKIGVWGDFDAGKINYLLPDKTSRFHVFQVGQLSPALMGLMETNGLWFNVADTCHKKKLVVDIYSQFGIEFPRTQTWYMVTRNRNLIFAIKEVPSISVSLREVDIFLRVYTNAFFQSRRAGINVDDIKVTGQAISTTDDVLKLQNMLTAWQTLPGVAYAFVNGYKVSHVTMFSAKVGDYVELVYDSSVERIVDFPLKDLKAFNSTLDKKVKYLLHYPGQGSGTIDYHDDIDFFLVRRNPRNGRHRGVYYHRNAQQADAVRMVTHKDYAIPVDYIDAYLDSQTAWNFEEVLLRMHVRQSGYHRPLIDEANRIKELYKMKDADIAEALLSVDAVVPNWTAATLEASAYAEVMRSPTANMSPRLVQDAYGYNAISKLLCDSPLFIVVNSGQRTVNLPYGLQVRCGAYEYDASGFLLGYYQHTQGALYSARNKNTRLVEFVAGILSTQLEETYGAQEVEIDAAVDYRFYTCGIEYDGTINNKWVDVTDTALYAIVDNKVTWFTNPATTYTLVRGNSRFLAYSLNLDNSDGLVRFSLTHLAMRGGTLGNHVMQIPMGELDVFMNGRSLIKDVDYYVDFPVAVVTNKAYLSAGTTQHIDVRFTGFCHSDMSMERFDENGFIDHGLLSSNNRFDIRDDKIQRITAGGALYERQELLFAEDDLGVRVPDARNGLPYSIRDVIAPLRGIAADDTYTLRAKSVATDKVVRNYLTQKLPQQTFNTPNAIKDLYPVFSPFCAKILFDLKNGNLNDPRLKAFYSDSDVYDICEPYEALLKCDPTQDGLQPDLNYVAVHPHQLNTVVDVDIYGYKFLTRVVKLYLKGRVNLSQFIRLSA